MAVVEVRCPRCGSPCSKSKKTHEYQCDHCGATFRFVDATKKEVIRDIRAHNCPICGRPVEAAEGYVCKQCGTEYLCKNCVEEIEDPETSIKKFVCRPCLKDLGLNCDMCSNKYTAYCVVCGKKFCEKHAEFNLAFKERKTEKGYAFFHYFSLWCEKCRGLVCRTCVTEKSSFFGGRQLCCKKCESKLKQYQPITERHRLLNEEVRQKTRSLH